MPPQTRLHGAGDLDAASAAMLSIGALARATAIPVETLRTWERRYGYPVPVRKPSGHRLYPATSVSRLRRVAQALALGHRAAQVVPASESGLDVLLGENAGRLTALRAAPPAPSSRADELLAAVEAFDAEALVRMLTAEWARLGPIEFLERRVAPLLTAVGDAWAGGDLDVAHEHFVAERLSDLMRTLRLPLEEHARGPLLLLATLPGELHGLGLQMAALGLTAAGCRVCNLGTDVPIEDIAAHASKLGARAVGLSVSTSSAGRRSTERIARLRKLLPRRIGLVVGGAGAPQARAGVEVLRDVASLAEWGRRLGGHAAAPKPKEHR
jgi:methanogenic corrinoid protein MtbC1